LDTTVDDRPAVPAEDPSNENRLREQRQRLLEAYYGDILSKVEELPLRTKTGPRSNGPLGRRWQSRFRWRWLLRYFVVDHVRRNLAAIKRHNHLRVAFAEDPAIPDRDLAALENYEKSLPPVGVKHFLLLSIIVILGLTYLVTQAIASLLDPAPQSAITSFFRDIISSSVAEVIPMLKACRNLAPKLQESWVGIVSELEPRKGWSSLVKAVFADWSTLLTFLSLVLLSTYLLALVPASAFRLKRLLFGQRGDLPAICTCTTRSRATGLYSDERAFFAKLKAAQPVEVPFDLLVPLMVVAFWILVLGLNAQWLGDGQPGYSRRDGVMVAALLLLPAGRLWWIAQLYYLRMHDPDGSRWGRAEATSPIARASLLCGVGSLVFMPLGFLALFLAVLHRVRNPKLNAKARSSCCTERLGRLPGSCTWPFDDGPPRFQTAWPAPA
jgi:hypothetical protein